MRVRIHTLKRQKYLFCSPLTKQYNPNHLIEQHPAVGTLRDSYVLEFLDVPENYKEKDLRKSIITNLKQFILEFGKDFTFVGEEYRVQVGNTDFFIDLLFYNRALSCLVAAFHPQWLQTIRCSCRTKNCLKRSFVRLPCSRKETMKNKSHHW